MPARQGQTESVRAATEVLDGVSGLFQDFGIDGASKNPNEGLNDAGQPFFRRRATRESGVPQRISIVIPTEHPFSTWPTKLSPTRGSLGLWCVTLGSSYGSSTDGGCTRRDGPRL